MNDILQYDNDVFCSLVKFKFEVALKRNSHHVVPG